jgi:hypothetical protein
LNNEDISLGNNVKMQKLVLKQMMYMAKGFMDKNNGEIKEGENEAERFMDFNEEKFRIGQR